MKISQQVISGAIAGAIALAAGSAAAPAFAKKDDNEKCAGIVKAGKNDCGTSKSACAGTSTSDRDPEVWLYVPKGTCERIAGGKIVTDPNATHGGAAGAAKKG
jgi:uncharacterized membrane protein